MSEGHGHGVWGVSVAWVVVVFVSVFVLASVVVAVSVAGRWRGSARAASTLPSPARGPAPTRPLQHTHGQTHNTTQRNATQHSTTHKHTNTQTDTNRHVSTPHAPGSRRGSGQRDGPLPNMSSASPSRTCSPPHARHHARAGAHTVGRVGSGEEATIPCWTSNSPRSMRAFQRSSTVASSSRQRARNCASLSRKRRSSQKKSISLPAVVAAIHCTIVFTSGLPRDTPQPHSPVATDMMCAPSWSGVSLNARYALSSSRCSASLLSCGRTDALCFLSKRSGSIATTLRPPPLLSQQPAATHSSR
eukprot:1034651-Rhodomonas_salina.1